jgi:hypothetical protein
VRPEIEDHAIGLNFVSINTANRQMSSSPMCQAVIPVKRTPILVM